MKLQHLSLWKSLPLSYRIRVWIADKCHALYILFHPDQPLQEVINFEEVDEDVLAAELDELDDDFYEDEYDYYPTLEDVLK